MIYDELFSMEHGPICSSTLNGIDGELNDKSIWEAYIFLKDAKTVIAKKKFIREDLDEISDFEIGILEALWTSFGKMSAAEIRNYTHKHCPEYVEVKKGSRAPISYRDLLKALGEKNPEEIEDNITRYRRECSLLDA
jgi:uncharacterized phage-associated protein